MKRHLLPIFFSILPLWAFAHNGVDDGDEIATSSWLHPPPAPDAIYQVHHAEPASYLFVYPVIFLIALLISAVLFWKKRN